MEAAPLPNLGALFLGVWVIYLFDRILDVSRAPAPELLTRRHRWAEGHLRVMALIGFIALGLLIATILPHLEKATVLAGMVPGLVTLLYYLIFRFLKTFPCLWRLPYKELTVAICFALGISISVTTEPAGGYHLCLMGGLVLLFSGNCLLIARDESELDHRNDPAAHFAGAHEGCQTRWPDAMLVLAFLSSLPLMILGGFPLTSSCLFICSGLTLLLARSETGDGPAFIQAKADGILMIPLLLALSRVVIFR